MTSRTVLIYESGNQDLTTYSLAHWSSKVTKYPLPTPWSHLHFPIPRYTCMKACAACNGECQASLLSCLPGPGFNMQPMHFCSYMQKHDLSCAIACKKKRVTGLMHWAWCVFTGDRQERTSIILQRAEDCMRLQLITFNKFPTRAIARKESWWWYGCHWPWTENAWTSFVGEECLLCVHPWSHPRKYSVLCFRVREAKIR